MGLFSSFTRAIGRAVGGVVGAVQSVAEQVVDVAKEAAPLLQFLPGPIGTIAGFVTAAQAPQQFAGFPTQPAFTGSQGQPVGVAGFGAQQTRQTFGPAAQAQFFGGPAPFLPARSQFPFFGQPPGSGFSAPFQAQTFGSGFAGSTARSPFAFFGQNFQNQQVIGARQPLPAQQFGGGGFGGFGFAPPAPRFGFGGGGFGGFGGFGFTPPAPRFAGFSFLGGF